MTEHDVVLVGIGAVTSVGLSAAETSASVRAGTARFTSAPWADMSGESSVISEVPNDALGPLADRSDELLSSREARVLRLARLAIGQCVEPLEAVGARAGLVVAAPELELQYLRGPASFFAQLVRPFASLVTLGEESAHLRGRAGGLLAVRAAAERLRAGRDQFVIAGAADSYRSYATLSRLDRERRLKSSRTFDGFIPGEGAGFVLLTLRHTALSLRWPVLAALSRVAEGFEHGHLYSDVAYRGDGLAGTFRALFGATPPESIREVYSSMNGENFWAKEWGVAFLRNRRAFSPDVELHHPADCFGDIGAAAGPVMVGLAAVGMNKGFRRSSCLVYCASDHGPRAAVSVSAT